MTNTPPTRPYGSWPSPLTIERCVATNRSISAPWLDGDDTYVLEGRPDEGGRVVLVGIGPDGTAGDVTPAGFNVRSRVHEYGGGAYTVSRGLVVFTNFDDTRLYTQATPGAVPEPLTADGRQRFADLSVDRARGRVIAVLEDHTLSDQEPRNAVAAVSLQDGSVATLVEGHDFFSDPRLSPDGRRLSWLSWDRPLMPWDGTTLWVGDVAADGSVTGARAVAGGPEESIVNPTWGPDGSLVFASDRTGWWNPWRWRDGSAPEQLLRTDAEFANAAWVFGLRYLGVDRDGTVVGTMRQRGRDSLVVLEPGGPRTIAVPANELDGLLVGDGVAVLVARGPRRATALVRVDLATGEVRELRIATPLPVDPAYLSEPRLLEFPSAGGRTAYAWYYPPANPDVVPPPDELPPLIVISHGGPTSNASTALDLSTQAFTSRGFAVVDVDYGGSTGYGRAYRNLLRDRWGIVDLEDCCAAATWLAEQGLADPARLAIRGGSAGGYTTLAALAFRDVFHAGASYFGVGDLEALARETHKFESRYLDLLVGPYPAAVETYRDRSPIHAVGRISCPVLVLQGEDDRVVPKEQAEEIVAALAERGLPHGYLLFPGEGHGFRRAENRQRALEAELSFFAQVFDFELADPIEPFPLTRGPR
jgi:dipeptidyl aminopeptidase/acylaminoacyl peptidase